MSRGFRVIEMSQVNRNVLEQEVPKIRDLPQKLDPVSAPKIPQAPLPTTGTRLYSMPIKTLPELLRSQLKPNSGCHSNNHDSSLIVRHSNTPAHGSGPLSLRPREFTSAATTGGTAWVAKLIRFLESSRFGLDARMWLMAISSRLHIPSQALGVIKFLPALQVLRNPPRPCRELLPYGFILSQLPVYEISRTFLLETSGQLYEGKDSNGQEHGREHGHDSRASSSRYNPIPAEAPFTSESPEAELDIIKSYACSSEGSESRAGTRPTSLNSQYGCALANEEDYVAEYHSDQEDEDWDECETSSAED